MDRVILGIYLISLIVLLFYTSHAYYMIFLYYFKFRKRVRSEKNDKYLKGEDVPHVTVQLPVYNERYVLKRLVDAACRFDWPKNKLEIQILDDSTDETTIIAESIIKRYRKEGFDIVLLHRDNREGYKAGALKEGLKVAKGEFVAIFDADFIPPSDFLRRTISYFIEDSKTAVVQTRWGHLNDRFSSLTMGQAIALDGHFYIEQQMRNHEGVFITFNGTAGIWRKQAIYDAGGWEGDTLTEDVDLSYRAQLKGWNIKFLPNVVCMSEVPPDVNGFKAQQIRWARGTIQTAKKLLGRLLKSKIPLKTKYEGFIHLTNHIVYPFLLLISLLFLPILIVKQSGDYDIYYNLSTFFLLGVIPYPLMYGVAQKALYKDWKKRLLYIPLITGGCMALSIANTVAVVQGLSKKKYEFTRTPKFSIVGNQGRMKKKYKFKKSITTIVEFSLFLYLLTTTLYAIVYMELAILPFLILYTLGFGYISILSFSQSLQEKRALYTNSVIR